MEAIAEQINRMGKAFVDFSLPMLVQSCLLIIVIFGLDLILRKKVRSVFRYCLWLLILAKLVIPPSFSTPAGVGNLFGDKLTEFNIERTEIVLEPKTKVLNDRQPLLFPTFEYNKVVPMQAERQFFKQPLPSENFTQTQAFKREPQREQQAQQPVTKQAIPPQIQTVPAVSITWQGAVFIIWFAIAIAMLMLVIQRAIFVMGLARQAELITGGLNETLRNYCNLLGVKGQIILKSSANATSPAVCGLFRPVVLIPRGLLSRLTREQIKTVFIHELIHIRRGDLWVNLIQTLLQIVYFYNPLLWFANAMIRRIREQAVDEAVQVALGSEAENYPKILVDVAKLAFKRPALSLRLIGVVESKSALKTRIARMISRPIPKKAKLGVLGLLIIIVTGLILLPMAESKYDEPQFIIKGMVTDTDTGKPIAGAKVFDNGYGPGPDWKTIKVGERAKWGAITDSNGQYSYLTWYEEHGLKCDANNYASQSIGFGTKIFRTEKEMTRNFALKKIDKTDVKIEAETSSRQDKREEKNNKDVKIIYVDADSAGANNGSSWANAYRYLQDALAACEIGCEVRVAQGVYKPDQVKGGTTGDRQATFTIGIIAIKGGYAGFGSSDPDERNIAEYETILSGDLKGDDGPNFANTDDNCFRVLTVNSDVIIDGFTITGGNSDGSGAGLICVADNPTISNCIFRGNAAVHGGAMYISGRKPKRIGGEFIGLSPTLTNCKFLNNSAVYGGAIVINDSNPNFRGCIFIGNSTVELTSISGTGGAICNTFSDPNFINCVFNENSATRGGAIFNTQSDPIFSHCTFTANTVKSERGTGTGSAIYNSISNPTLINCAFIGNSGGKAGAIYNIQSNPVLNNCTFDRNQDVKVLDLQSERKTGQRTNVQIEAGKTEGQGEEKKTADANNTKYELSKIDILRYIKARDETNTIKAINNLFSDFANQPDLAVTLYEIAGKCESSQLFNQAEAIYQQITQRFPQSPQAQEVPLALERINTFFKPELDSNSIVISIDKFVADFNNRTDLLDILHEIGDKYQTFKKYNLAEIAYRKIIDINSNCEHAAEDQESIGWTYYQRGLYDQSIIEYRKVVERYPQNRLASNAQYWVAQSYLRKKDYKQALAEYQKVIDMYPDSNFAVLSREVIAKIKNAGVPL